MRDAQQCEALLDDPDPVVREAAQESSWELDPEAVQAVVWLARHPEAMVREMVAARPDLGPDLVTELREDPNEDVRMRARRHPFPRTWAEYWAIQRVMGHGHGPDCVCPITEPATETPPARPTGRTC
ncbi:MULTISPECIES: HEAT repeat domain-containing protein [unclassified Streptomyces]|uniref:HEAT repeat domain-containing protein n=1 Tax=unclassified Streptomyces TaxID=2593676 RepID=UPI002E2BE0A1|nr:HEAT repeat domain-containing protein [Streptomyces sp. NBC_01439]